MRKPAVIFVAALALAAGSGSVADAKPPADPPDAKAPIVKPDPLPCICLPAPDVA
jgi:hypothetical protein